VQILQQNGALFVFGNVTTGAIFFRRLEHAFLDPRYLVLLMNDNVSSAHILAANPIGQHQSNLGMDPSM
jgi:hypothetical protein